MGDIDWEKIVSNLSFMLLMALGAAWCLGVLGVDRPFLERVGVAFLSLWFVIYAASEGTEIGFSRCVACNHVHAEEMPEAEQAVNE